MKKLREYNQKVRLSREMPELRSGDIVKVYRKVKEGGKERTQVFEGIVIAVKGKQSSSPMVTVRRVSSGVGVEITVPIYSPLVEKIEVVKRVKTRKSKLYYLRRKDFKLSKLKTKELDKFVTEETEENKVEAKEATSEERSEKSVEEKKEKKENM